MDRRIYDPDAVRQAREEAGYTQAQAAKAASIAHRTITNVETGRGARVETLVQLACLYNVPLGRFIRADVLATK